MGRIRILVLEPDKKTLWRMLKRHNDKILAVAFVIRVTGQQAGAIIKQYRAREGLEPLLRLVFAQPERERS